MKKTIRIALSLFALIVAFSCAKEIETEVDEKINETIQEDTNFEYIFRIVDNTPSKTTLSGSTVTWESGDKIGVFADGTINKFGTISSLNPVQFPVYLATALDKDDIIYCYYPYNKDDNDTRSATNIALKIPTTQTGDFDAMPQVAVPYVVPAAMATGSTNVADIHFFNTGAIVRFLVYSSSGAYTSETVESIKFTANKNFAGNFNFNASLINYADETTLVGAGYSANSVILTASPTIGANKGTAGNADMIIAPDNTVGYTGTIVLTTNVARYTYTISSAMVFPRNGIKQLGLNLESATCSRVEKHPTGDVFIPATSIASGDKILVTSGTSGTVGVFGEDRGNNRLGYQYTIADDVIISDENIYPLTVGTGVTNDAYYTLYDVDTDGYIAVSSSNSNNMKTNALISEDSEWEIVIDGTSKATTFKATGSSYTRNYFRYNSGNTPPLFSAYASGKQDDVYIFKKSDATVVSAANKDIAYSVTSVEIPYTVYNASGATTVAFKTNPGSCANNLAINEGTKKVTFDITANTGVTRTVEVNITNNGVTKTVTINQASAPTKLVMSTITAVPGQNQIAFSWDAVDDVEGYQISTDGGTSYGATQTATSYTWTGLTSFTNYTIKVKAIGDGVYYVDSDPGTLTAKTTLALPTGLTWTKGTKTVTWTDTNTSVGTYGTDYEYQYTIDNGANFTSVTGTGNTVTLTITETKAFKIKAVYLSDATYNSALSDALTCTIGAPAVYTATFNNSGEYTSSPSYSSNSYTVSGVTWDLSYADIVSTGSPIDGTANIQARIAKNTTNSPSATTGNVLSASKKVSKVTFQSVKSASTISLTVEYSTDNGSSWSTLSYSEDATVDASNGYSGTLDETTDKFKLRFTWSVASSTKSHRDQKLDNVIVYAE